jgi:glycosyltransferase involved in cell wall biosynthesis
MRIVIDALGISRPGGGRAATLNLVHGLLAVDQDNCYRVYVDKHEPSLLEYGTRVQQRIIPLQNRFLARLWCQATWPTLFRLEQADLIHFTRSLGVLGVPGKQIITIYDLTVLLLPHIYPRYDVWYWRHIQPLSMKQANHIIAISQDVARDVHRTYDLPTERISVIYPAYRPSFRPLLPAECSPILKKYGLTPPYILHVGSISRKKNLRPLIQAAAHLREMGMATPLVLVGREYDRARDATLHQTISSSQLTDLVHFTGPVPDPDLPALYSGATVLAFPSLHEGFGITPLEAMACGLPVVTSGLGAIAEVTGSAAWIVDDPHSSEAWADALSRLLADSSLRQQMRDRGLARAADFSRDSSARQVLALYERVVHSS